MRRSAGAAALAGEAGSAAIEFGLMMPLLAGLLLFMLEGGDAFMTHSTLQRAATDALEIAAAMPDARIDGTSPATADALLSAQVFKKELGAIPGAWSVRIDEVEMRAGTVRTRTLSQGGDPAACPLPDDAAAKMPELSEGNREAVVTACLGWTKAFGHSSFRNGQFRLAQAVPMRFPIPASCAELRAAGIADDGVYSIDPDRSGPVPPFEAYCAMSQGGWTLVAAQFESGPAAWNAGIGAGYDPLLGNGKSFALSAAEIPPHGETGFGLNFQPASAADLPIGWNPDSPPKDVHAVASSGNAFDIDLDPDAHHPALDPESGTKVQLPIGLNGCLVVDKSGGIGRDWWFCANADEADARGAAYGGSDRSATADAAAWTIWVK